VIFPFSPLKSEVNGQPRNRSVFHPKPLFEVDPAPPQWINGFVALYPPPGFFPLSAWSVLPVYVDELRAFYDSFYGFSRQTHS